MNFTNYWEAVRLKLGVIGEVGLMEKNFLPLINSSYYKIEGISSYSDPNTFISKGIFPVFSHPETLINQSDVLFVSEVFNEHNRKSLFSNWLKNCKHIVFNPLVALELPELDALKKIAEEAKVKTSIISENQTFDLKNLLNNNMLSIAPFSYIEVAQEFELNNSLNSAEKKWYVSPLLNIVYELLSGVNEKLKNFSVHVMPLLENKLQYFQIQLVFFNGTIATIKLSNAGKQKNCTISCIQTKMKWQVDIEKETAEITRFEISPTGTIEDINLTFPNKHTAFFAAMENFGAAVISNPFEDYIAPPKNDALKISRQILREIEKRLTLVN